MNREDRHLKLNSRNAKKMTQRINFLGIEGIEEGEIERDPKNELTTLEVTKHLCLFTIKCLRREYSPLTRLTKRFFEELFGISPLFKKKQALAEPTNQQRTPSGSFGSQRSSVVTSDRNLFLPPVLGSS